MNILRHPVPMYLVISIIVGLLTATYVVSYIQRTEQDPTHFVFVAKLSDNCAEMLPSKKLTTFPLGFKVHPILAAKELPMGCWEGNATSVYADKDYYYFFNTMFGPPANYDTLKKLSYIIDGSTGKLVQVPKKAIQ